MSSTSRAYLAAVVLSWATSAFSQAAPPAPASEQPPGIRMGLGVGGEITFNTTCSACHVPQMVGGGDARAPKQETLRQYSPERIYSALTTGKMQAQGATLSDGQRRDVSEWLAARRLGAAESGDAKAMTNRCASDEPLRMSQPEWNGWGGAAANTRFQGAKAAGLTASDLPKLKLQWAFGFPNGVEAYSQPTVVGGRVFVGSDSGYLYALDAKTGCVHWSFLADAGIRSAPVAAPAKHGAAMAVYVGDLKANVYAVNARTGQLMWKATADDQPLSRITGAAAVHDGRVYVGTSSSEEISGLQPGYECCRNRGAVTALDAATGRELWKTYTIPETPKLIVSESGHRRWGPAGAGIWSAPTIDAKRRLLYVATGDAYTAPAAQLSDAVVALDLVSGQVVWAYQDTKDDVFVLGCGTQPNESCPKTVGPDWDFGASAALQTMSNGHDIVVAANKGGIAVALDPDKRGALMWRTNLAAKPPSARGDIIFGGAVDRERAYFALQETGGLASIDLATGKRRWFTPIVAPADRAKRIGSAAAVTAIPGVVFNGAWDGVLRAFSVTDGQVIWSYDTVRSFDTSNGVPAKGGSMAAPGVTVASGMLFVGSGYVGISDGMPGNVLLAFSKQQR